MAFFVHLEFTWIKFNARVPLNLDHVNWSQEDEIEHRYQ